MPAAAYPLPAFAFLVSIDASTGTDASFMEVSGIDPQTEVEEVAEGGLNGYVHRLPGVVRHSNLVLKRGQVAATSAIAQWAAQTIGSDLTSPIQTKTVLVSMLGPGGQPVMTWTFENAWPVKWETGALNAASSQIVTETLEIAYATVSRTIATAPAA